ncbi:putative RNA methyltransferase [Pseudarthrobacter sp. PS3-L1]|uniref:putative RNA methyltransferase n=1 Tax=Pseudarthrobacter sp. PS3-L1 TaxID=3046207 RepID=UPI0024BAD860|nr:methyltransferase domain-containing protein [Pseudarthrobacter sp. PS3-L1]MDJ0320137.1 methyltransferase domain-containing protein [Pseudarthrobacter sp. PS3-L1]
MPFPEVLLCPVCRLDLHHIQAIGQQRALRCTQGHSFDAARQGYFNLLAGKGTAFASDTAEMVEARVRFLSTGHYRELAAGIAHAVEHALDVPAPVLLDSGTGTGYYLREVLDRQVAHGVAPAAVGMDISKFALRRAGRLNPEALNISADIWDPLPLRDSSVHAVMVVFAPRNPAEFARVLTPGGVLVVATPRQGHLAELATLTGMLGIESDKDDRLFSRLQPYFRRGKTTDVTIPLLLSASQAADLAFMGPAGHHMERNVIHQRILSSLDGPDAPHSQGAASAGNHPFIGTPEMETEGRFNISTFYPLHP